MDGIRVDPRISIKVVPDGEVHICFSWTKDDLATMAQAFLAVMDGKIKPEEAMMVFRIRNVQAIDYMISELQKARNTLVIKK